MLEACVKHVQRLRKDRTITMWGFPKIGGTILGVPIKSTIVFWDLHWGPPISRNYPVAWCREYERVGAHAKKGLMKPKAPKAVDYHANCPPAPVHFD